MDISIYFSPLSLDKSKYHKEQVGGQIRMFTVGNDFPDWDSCDLIFFGVKEERGSVDNHGCGAGADIIRKRFFSLFFPSLPKSVDLGNVLPGETLNDTYYAIKNIIDVFIRANKTVLIIGGSQDLTLALYQGFENSEQLVNLTTIDKQFDVGLSSETPSNSETYLSRVLLHQPNYLFNYSNIGYQTYFCSPDVLSLMDSLFFDRMRLGEMRNDIREVEPILRNTDIVSLDVASIQASDMQGCGRATPNGLLPDEVCRLARYSGLSEKVSVFGVFEYNPKFDSSGKSALLVAELIWYFVEGFIGRKREVPKSNDPNFLRYLVPVSGVEDDVVFYKSLITDRWWMLVPYPPTSSTRYRRLNMVPCSYSDYLTAGKDVLPDLWMKTYRKYL